MLSRINWNRKSSLQREICRQMKWRQLRFLHTLDALPSLNYSGKSATHFHHSLGCHARADNLKLQIPISNGKYANNWKSMLLGYIFTYRCDFFAKMVIESRHAIFTAALPRYTGYTETFIKRVLCRTLKSRPLYCYLAHWSGFPLNCSEISQWTHYCHRRCAADCHVHWWTETIGHLLQWDNFRKFYP